MQYLILVNETVIARDTNANMAHAMGQACANEHQTLVRVMETQSLKVIATYEPTHTWPMSRNSAYWQFATS